MTADGRKEGSRARGGARLTATEPAFSYSDSEGEAAVAAARAVVEAAVRGERRPRAEGLPARFKQRAGVFTTLTLHPLGELRGCIGFAEPVLPLEEAIAASAAAAAVEDGRFPPVEPLELDHVVVEVSLLTVPRRLEAATAQALVKAVEVGRHGLIVRDGRRGGLLLPQVAPEWGWSAQEFLEHTCAKGGFEPDFWRSREAKVFTFEAEIFAESAPRGRVERRARGPSGSAGHGA